MRWIANPQRELLSDDAQQNAATEADGAFPPRPCIPVALSLAAGIWAGAATALSGLAGIDETACVQLSVACLLFALVCLALWWKWRCHALVWVLAVGLFVGAGLGSAQAARLHHAQGQLAALSGKLYIEAVADGSEGAYGASCIARVWSDGVEPLLATVSFPDGYPAPAYGSVYEGHGSVSALSEARAAYCWEKGAVAQVKLRTCSAVERGDMLGMLVGIRARAVDMLTNPQRIDGGLAAAVVCGWRAALPSELYQDFQVSGLAHVVAVSGAHLSIVVAFVAAVMKLARLPRWLSVTTQIALILAYLVLTAVPVSAIRAAIMTFAGLLSWTARRRASSLAALSICIAAMVSFTPQVALSASFALSALSTLGIVLFGSLFDAWIAHAAPRVPSFVREALSLTCSSSLLATPVSAALFSQLPVVSPLANMATGPLFGPVCTIGIVCTAGGVALPGGSSVLVQAACGAAYALRVVVHAVASIPYASVPVTLGMGAALALAAISAGLLWFWWPRPKDARPRASAMRRCAFGIGAVLCGAIALLSIVGPARFTTELVALDVGQGDAILLRSEGKTMLIDTGNQDTLLREALARHHVTHLDALLITHPDDDHMGSLPSLRGVVQVDRVLVANDALTCSCTSCAKLRASATQLVGEQALEGIQVQDVVALGAYNLTCVWPRTYTDEGGNADSVCLLADTDLDRNGEREWRALLVGDAEHDQLQTLLASDAVGSVDVYKVGHHGSKNALTLEQAQALAPSISLVSVGAYNRYGHPAANTIEALEAAGSQILRTDEHGDVVCKFTEERINVKCLR